MTPRDIRPLTPAALPDWLRFFEKRAFVDNPRWQSCYCWFPHHDPAKVEWKTRTGDENRGAMCAAIRSGEAHGWLAYHGADVVAWCNAAPWRAYPMLADEPVDDPDRTGVVFCFVVAPELRGQGMARALLDAACGGFAAQGLRYAIGRPSRTATTAAANHYGPLAMYLAAGFAITHEDSEGYVTVRKVLQPGAA